jgi:hypothetical protein
MSLMIAHDKPNEAYTAAHAIAGFQLADIAFGVLVRNGILPKSDAERLLKQAIAGNRTGDASHQAAAELLGIVSQTLFNFQPPTPIERREVSTRSAWKLRLQCAAPMRCDKLSFAKVKKMPGRVWDDPAFIRGVRSARPTIKSAEHGTGWAAVVSSTWHAPRGSSRTRALDAVGYDVPGLRPSQQFDPLIFR